MSSPDDYHNRLRDGPSAGLPRNTYEANADEYNRRRHADSQQQKTPWKPMDFGGSGQQPYYGGGLDAEGARKLLFLLFAGLLIFLLVSGGVWFWYAINKPASLAIPFSLAAWAYYYLIAVPIKTILMVLDVKKIDTALSILLCVIGVLLYGVVAATACLLVTFKVRYRLHHVAAVVYLSPAAFALIAWLAIEAAALFTPNGNMVKTPVSQSPHAAPAQAQPHATHPASDRRIKIKRASE